MKRRVRNWIASVFPRYISIAVFSGCPGVQRFTRHRSPQKKKYERVKTMEDDDEDDDGKDLIADEIFTGDADGDLEEGETVDVPIQHHEDEEGEDEESGEDPVSLEMV